MNTTIIVEFVKENWVRNLSVVDEYGNTIQQENNLPYEKYVRKFDQLVKKYKMETHDKVIEVTKEWGEVLRLEEMTLQFYYTGE